MNKKIIITLLCSGWTNSKKTAGEIFKGAPHYLKALAKVTMWGNLQANGDKFWKSSNNENRNQLIDDIARIHRADIRDNAYFRIVNRFANGDKYGAELSTGGLL